MIEYADIYMKKCIDYSFYVICLIFSYQILQCNFLPMQNKELNLIKKNSECVCCSTQYKVTAQKLLRQTYSEHCQTFKMEYFAKRIMPECRCTTRNVSEQGRGYGTSGHFNEDFVKNTRKRGQQGKILEFFSQTLLKIHFEQKI